MSTLTFDTHDIIKKFREKGLAEDLAELQVEAIKDVVNELVKSELTRWVVAVGVLQTSIITALLVKLTVRI